MALPRTTRQIHEYEELSYEDLTSVQELEELVRASGKRVFAFFRRRLRAQQYVGLVQTSSETIEILPKVYPKEAQNLGVLILLLRLTGIADLRPVGTAGLETHRGSFLQIWIRHFADTLHRLLTHRYRRQYVEVERATGFIRGRLQIEKMQTGREELSGQFPCRYELYTPDHRMNQVLKRCARLLCQDAHAPRVRSRLQACLDALEGVSDRPVTASDLDRIHLNRLNQEYESILRLCRLLLKDSTLGIRSGATDQLALVFNMNRLFESAIETLLRRFQGRLQIGGRPIERVDRQVHVGSLFGEFAMQVDLVVTDDHGHRTLIDTKYKALGPEQSHGGLSQSDFYQMHAYATAGDRPYDRVVLLYPSAHPIQRRFSSSGVELLVRTVDLKAFYDSGTGHLASSAAAEALQNALPQA
jgi:5-methylcytosine-specific restriction enzyme subunit McrC